MGPLDTLVRLCYNGKREDEMLTPNEKRILCSHAIVRMMKLWKDAIEASGTDVALDDFESSSPIIEKLWEAERDKVMREAWTKTP